MIERQIIIGMITSTDYLKRIQSIWNPLFIESATAKRIAGWCWEYFKKYDKAPGRKIESIYYAKLKRGKVPKDLFSEIEEDILPGLSEEYEKEGFNLEYLMDETETYFNERHLTLYSNNIQALVSQGELTQAAALACEFKMISTKSQDETELGDPSAEAKIDKAFEVSALGIIRFPGALGRFLNSHLVRGGLVALMGPEKRGKTFWLLEFAKRALKGGMNVAFFQAGDMTESQQIIRSCIYDARKSNLKKYCKEHFEPVLDCIKNQMNDCALEEREGDEGVFDELEEKEIRQISYEDLISAWKEHKSYKVCTHCDRHKYGRIGAVWIKKVPTVEPLTKEEAKKLNTKFFKRYKGRFKLSSHSNDTLTVEKIRAILTIWEKQDDFIPDVIVIDYADLLTTEHFMEERPKQNNIWKGLRRLSQEKGQPLVITATQADAASYESSVLKLKNFSEDKRKYAHVTAMWGLNQDPGGREKKIGLMRINELVIREGDFAADNKVTVLQNLRRGRPFIGSYW